MHKSRAHHHQTNHTPLYIRPEYEITPLLSRYANIRKQLNHIESNIHYEATQIGNITHLIEDKENQLKVLPKTDPALDALTQSIDISSDTRAQHQSHQEKLIQEKTIQKANLKKTINQIETIIEDNSDEKSELFHLAKEVLGRPTTSTMPKNDYDIYVESCLFKKIESVFKQTEQTAAQELQSYSNACNTTVHNEPNSWVSRFGFFQPPKHPVAGPTPTYTF